MFEQGIDGAFVLGGRAYLSRGPEYVRLPADGSVLAERSLPQLFRHRWSDAADYRLTDVRAICRFAALARAHPVDGGLAAFLLPGPATYTDPYGLLGKLFGWDGEEVRWCRRHSRFLSDAPADEDRFEIEFLLELTDLFAFSGRLGAGPSQLRADVWARLYAGGTGSDVDAAGAALYGLLARRTDPAVWPVLSRTIHDELNEARRDALVAAVIARSTDPIFHTARDLFDWFLIDVLRDMQDAVDAHRNGSLTDTSLQRALSRLTVAEVTGAPKVPLTVAQAPTPRFGVTLDDVRFTELSQSQLIQLGNERGGNLPDTSALGYILADGQFNGSMKDLADLLANVEKWVPRLLVGEQPDGSQAAQIARMVNDDPVEQQKLRATFGAKLSGVSGPQCRELGDFVNRRYPNFLTNLKKKYVSGYVFASRSGASQGAGKFDGSTKTVHMAMMGDKAPEAFVRLFVHETGHASFQRELLGPDKLATLLTTGTYAAEHQRLADLCAALETTGQSPKRPQGPRPRIIPGGQIDTALLQSIETAKANIKNADIAWSAMSADAKAFYQSWQKPRGQNGMYMIGIDMGRASNRGMLAPADRQKYQADDFTEFCAESFMHLAYGDLDTHVAVLQTRPDVPDDVKQAWVTAQTIVRKLGTPILS